MENRQKLYILSPFHCWTIHNSKYPESNIENVVQLLSEYILAVKKNKITTSAGNLMALEKMMLTEVTQMQKNKWFIISHRSLLAQIFQCEHIYRSNSRNQESRKGPFKEEAN